MFTPSIEVAPAYSPDDSRIILISSSENEGTTGAFRVYQSHRQSLAEQQA
jgi:hypothetical protein